MNFKIYLSLFLLNNLLYQVRSNPIINDVLSVLGNSYQKVKSVKNEFDAMKYLNKFGYMEMMEMNQEDDYMNSTKMKQVVMEYQRFMDLPETGKIDTRTMEMMNMPRCGVKDSLHPRRKNEIKSNGQRKRVRRYQLQGSMWEMKNLTWKVTQYSTRENLIGREREIDFIMKTALDEWSRHTKLSFIPERGSKKPNIDIKFTVNDHNDGNPFDGPGKTLAHAFFPRYGGDTHFDDQESWAIDGRRGVDLMSVAVHEFGHALGLGHSDNKQSIMYPTYAGKRYKLELDDIVGIQMLYGKKEETPTQPSVIDSNEDSKPPVNAPDLCTDFKIDAADCTSDGKCFFFRDDFVWRINDDTSLHEGYPKKISDIFPELTGKLDSVTTDFNTGHTYIFKGNRVWIYDQLMKPPLKSGELISNEIKGLNIKNIDASTRWGFNGRTYFFKDNHYWRFDADRKSKPISKRYPQLIKVWQGLPYDLDAAMFWPKTRKTYFFKGPYYYRFNDLTSSVDEASPSFPRLASKWWLKCRKNKQLVESEKEPNSIDESNKSNESDEGIDASANDDFHLVKLFKSYAFNLHSKLSLTRLVKALRSLFTLTG